MTIALGIHLGTYAMLAADTRITYPTYLWLHDDAARKIQKTTLGLITGAGYVPLLDQVKRKLATESPTNTNDILAIIREARANMLEAGGEVQSLVQTTGWIFTYNSLADGQAVTRLAIFHPSVSMTEIGLYAKGDPCIVFPPEVPRDAADSITAEIKRSVKLPSELEPFDDNLGKNCSVIAVLIKSLQPYCPSISKRFQIGVHISEKTAISDIIDIPEDKPFQIHLNFDP